MNDPIAMYLSDVYTVSTNLAGLPAMSIPMGFKEGMPLGLQIIGNHFDEKDILKLSYLYQSVCFTNVTPALFVLCVCFFFWVCLCVWWGGVGGGKGRRKWGSELV